MDELETYLKDLGADIVTTDDKLKAVLGETSRHKAIGIKLQGLLTHCVLLHCFALVCHIAPQTS